VAYTVACEPAPATDDSLRAFLKERLPEYMVPAAFVTLPALPLTPNGKVDRKALSAGAAPEHSFADESYITPRTPIEEAVAGLCAELLGVERVGATDSFFELGGHSLLAVRLIARIEQIFGVKLPIATVFEAPTVEGMARVLLRGAAPARNSPLVRLHPGGVGRPLFLVHPVGGDISSYMELARVVGAGRPVYALQPVTSALDAEDRHPPTMEELAAQYLAAMRQVQAGGPWLLSGWSFGAVLAYEMARQIESSGETVALLALIDPPTPLQRNQELDQTLLLSGFAAFGRPSERQRELLREMLEGVDVETGFDRLLELGKAEGVLPPDVEKPWLRERFGLFSRNMQTLSGYVVPSYDGQVTLFRASGSLNPGATDLTSGWSALTRTETHLIESDHISMLRRPALDQVLEHFLYDLATVESGLDHEGLAARSRAAIEET
jgi:thioesterase domain-containing protein/acyl carrier protein